MKISLPLPARKIPAALYRGILIIGIGSLISACQSVTVGQSVSSGQSEVSAQATFSSGVDLNIAAFKLNQALQIAPGSAGVYIQKGKIRPDSDINPVSSYKPFCRLEVNRLSDSIQNIMPDRFEVTRIVREEEYVMRSVHLASSQKIRLGSGSLTAVIMATSFYLSSGTQGNIRRLVCSQWDDPVSGEHLTLEEIRIALGDIMTVVRTGE